MAIYKNINGTAELFATIAGGRKHVYGVVWDGGSDPGFTRTDEAAAFADPNPYYSGMVGSPSSPFDTLSPWSGMTKSERVGGTMVAIPKFYYKLGYESGTNGIKLQIAPSSNGAEWAANNNYKVSPAHIDRGDGTGERDVVYIGRYHCAGDYKSKTGEIPNNSHPRSLYRTEIHNLGAHIWQNDFAMRVTLWMLYLVEFASWDSQRKIGFGCSPNGSTISRPIEMGYTDQMPYHTGTIAESRVSYGGTQYRNIEGLWDNCFDFVDGIYSPSGGKNIYIIKNPLEFSDTTGGTLIGEVGVTDPNDTYIYSFSIPSVDGFDWAIMPSTSGSNNSYVMDSVVRPNAQENDTLYVGGYYTNQQKNGLFCTQFIEYMYGYGYYTSSRVMELP